MRTSSTFVGFSEITGEIYNTRSHRPVNAKFLVSLSTAPCPRPLLLRDRAGKLAGHIETSMEKNQFFLRRRPASLFRRVPPSLTLWRALWSTWPRRSLGQVGTQRPYKTISDFSRRWQGALQPTFRTHLLQILGPPKRARSGQADLVQNPVNNRIDGFGDRLRLPIKCRHRRKNDGAGL